MKLKNFSKFINESITNKELENTTIGRSVFEYNGSNYRLTGYLYVYRTNDGKAYTFSAVDKSDANAVTGAGVGGCIADLDKVTFLDITTTWSDETIEIEENRHKRRIEEEKDKYMFIKSMPIGLSESEYEEIVIDRVVRQAMLNNKE